MRILFVNDAAGSAGGVGTYLAAAASALSSSGHEIDLLFADAGAEALLGRAQAWKPDVCFSHNMRQLEVDEALAAEIPVVKMMHGHFGTCISGHKMTQLPEQVCTRLCGPACLLHYLPRRCGALRPVTMVRQHAWASRQRALYSSYRGVVLGSAYMRREYVRHGVPADRAHVVPMFVPDAAPAEASAIAERPVDVVFLGRMTPLKGAHRGIEAVALASERLGRRLEMVLAGDGPQRTDLQRLARARHVRATFPGWLDAEARDRLLASAKLLIVPSLWPEPFGLVGLEAGRVGVPSVAFDVGGISEWLRDGVNGLLVEPRRGPSGLADAIATALGEDRFAARLQAGAAALRDRFSADAHVKALETVFAAARRA